MIKNYENYIRRISWFKKDKKINSKNWFQNTKGSWTFLGILDLENEIDVNSYLGTDGLIDWTHNFEKWDKNWKLNYVSKNNYDEVSSVYWINTKLKKIIRLSKHWSDFRIDNKELNEESWDKVTTKCYLNDDIICNNIRSCWWNLNFDNLETLKDCYESLDENSLKLWALAIIDYSCELEKI